MNTTFIDSPGRRERHLKRKHNNSLFAYPAKAVDADELATARRGDEQELSKFMGQFQGLVTEAVELKPNEGSETILSLKERLDKAYEQASGLAGDQSNIRVAIQRLLAVIMSAVRQGASGDMQAQGELDQEDLARSEHFRLLEIPLVADLLDPESVIAESELVPTLLCESETVLSAALSLFDTPQLTLLVRDARELLDSLDAQGGDPGEARRRLEQMETRLEAMKREVKEPLNKS